MANNEKTSLLRFCLVSLRSNDVSVIQVNWLCACPGCWQPPGGFYILLFLLRTWAPACWPRSALCCCVLPKLLLLLPFKHILSQSVGVSRHSSPTDLSRNPECLFEEHWILHPGKFCCGKAAELVFCSIVLAWECFVQSPNKFRKPGVVFHMSKSCCSWTGICLMCRCVSNCLQGHIFRAEGNPCCSFSGAEFVHGFGALELDNRRFNFFLFHPGKLQHNLCFFCLSLDTIVKMNVVTWIWQGWEAFITSLGGKGIKYSLKIR